MYPGAGAFKTLENFQAPASLQEGAVGKTTGHDNGDDPGHSRGFQIEAITIEHDADNRTEHDQGNQAGQNRLNQAFFDIDGFCSG